MATGLTAGQLKGVQARAAALAKKGGSGALNQFRTNTNGAAVRTATQRAKGEAGTVSRVQILPQSKAPQVFRYADGGTFVVTNPRMKTVWTKWTNKTKKQQKKEQKDAQNPLIEQEPSKYDASLVGKILHGGTDALEGQITAIYDTMVRCLEDADSTFTSYKAAHGDGVPFEWSPSASFEPADLGTKIAAIVTMIHNDLFKPFHTRQNHNDNNPGA